MALTPDQIQEAIKELEGLGFVVVHKDRGHIRDKDRVKVTEKLKAYEKVITQRLQELGLPCNETDLNNFLYDNRSQLEHNGKYCFHQVYDLSHAFILFYLLKGDLRDINIEGLFQHAVSLGALLPKGKANHQYDEQHNFRVTRQKTGKKRKDLENYEKIKAFCIKEASRIWKRSPSVRLGGRQGMVDRLAEKLPVKFQNIPDGKLPADSSIRKYLIQADQAGQITIPPEARKRGAPPKK